MPYPRNPYSTPNVSFFGSSGGGGSKGSNGAAKFDPAPHPGLVNLGNTCFLNSVLQAMGSTRQFKLLLQGPSEELQEQYGQQLEVYDGAEFELIKRSQSPALRVRDEEHGKPSSPILRRNLGGADAVRDGLATMKPRRDSAGPVAQGTSNGTILDVESTAAPPHEPTVVDLPLNTALRHTMEKIWGSSNNLRGPSINPKRLLTLLGAKYDQYLEYGQQDGHELMRHLLDACRMEEMDLIKKMQPPKPAKGAKGSRQNGVQPSSGGSTANAAAAASRSGAAHDSSAVDLQLGDVDRGEAIAAPMSYNQADHAAVVSADSMQAKLADTDDAVATEAAQEALLPFLDMLFCGKLASMIVCETCKKVSHTYEDFFDLSLSIRAEGDNKVKKRDRIRNMADRWRRATQGKPAEKESVSTANSATPVATPVFSETEASDADGKKPHKKRGSFLSSGGNGEDGLKPRFSLRNRGITRRPTTAKRVDKLGATSGSEMEPDFPDMASLSLAPPSRQLVADSAPPSAGEDNGDARTSTRLGRMLAPHGLDGAGDSSSREPSPAARGGSGPASAVPAAVSSHQAAYIARILSEEPVPAPQLHGLQRRPATASGAFADVVHQASAINGRPFQGLSRGLSTRAPLKSALCEFETDPGSPAAKRRRRIQEEQTSTGLIAALRQFTSVEVLDGDNSFACKNCWRLQNPPSARDRERYRRRKERRGLRYGSDDESEPSSSEGGSGSEGEQGKRAARAQVPSIAVDGAAPNGRGTNGHAIGGEGAATIPQSVSAPGKLSIPTITTHAGTPPATDEVKQLSIDTQSAANLSAPRRDVHGHRPPDSPMSAVSHQSDSNLSASASASGYDTGTETDQSGADTSMDSETGLDDSEAESASLKRASLPAGAKPKGPKRSTQSLPRRALKRYLIASAPPVLVFHLKRFQATGRGFVSGLAGFKKIEDQVTFPEYLDITPWLAPPREEYDRKGRLKGTSDPLVLRKRAEEEARRAGMDVRDVQVQVDKRRGRQKHGRHAHWLHPYGDEGEDGAVPGKRHSMWSWTAKERSRSHGRTHESGTAAAAAATADATDEIHEGPLVKQGDKEILPSVVSRPKTQYRLYAVIVHQGSLSAGHYTAYVLSDKIRLSSEEKANLALTATVTRSAPASRVHTPAVPSDLPRERRRSTQLSEPPMPALQPLSEVGDSGATRAGASPSAAPPSADMQKQLSSSGSTTSSLGGGGGGARGGPPPLLQPKPQQAAAMQVDFLRPQTSISSIGSLDSGPSHGDASIHSLDGPDDHMAAAPPPLVFSNGSAVNGTPNSSADSLKARSPEMPLHKPATPASSASVPPRPDTAVIDDGRRWVYTSDTVVRAASIDEVLKAKAYMLFYERV